MSRKPIRYRRETAKTNHPLWENRIFSWVFHQDKKLLEKTGKSLEITRLSWVLTTLYYFNFQLPESVCCLSLFWLRKPESFQASFSGFENQLDSLFS